MLVANGQLVRIATTSDGGWRVTYDFPGDSTTGIVMAALATLRDCELEIAVKELTPERP